jgi:hypothetical protein
MAWSSSRIARTAVLVGSEHAHARDSAAVADRADDREKPGEVQGVVALCREPR